ncbi:hypothetical protein EDD21DRAFT_378333 [Dissophora ornata]|nr:hypothetical protein EDD21DRAFT_378333 [Dissophora ornata]
MLDSCSLLRHLHLALTILCAHIQTHLHLFFILVSHSCTQTHTFTHTHTLSLCSLQHPISTPPLSLSLQYCTRYVPPPSTHPPTPDINADYSTQ